MSYSLEEQITEVKREIDLRARLYPKWAAAGKYSQNLLDRQLGRLRAALKTLESVQHENKAKAPQQRDLMLSSSLMDDPF